MLVPKDAQCYEKYAKTLFWFLKFFVQLNLYLLFFGSATTLAVTRFEKTVKFNEKKKMLLRIRWNSVSKVSKNVNFEQKMFDHFFRKFSFYYLLSFFWNVWKNICIKIWANNFVLLQIRWIFFAYISDDSRKNFVKIKLRKKKLGKKFKKLCMGLRPTKPLVFKWGFASTTGCFRIETQTNWLSGIT